MFKTEGRITVIHMDTNLKVKHHEKKQRSKESVLCTAVPNLCLRGDTVIVTAF